jgi:hypothetical protein
VGKSLDATLGDDVERRSRYTGWALTVGCSSGHGSVLLALPSFTVCDVDDRRSWSDE